MLPAVGVAIGAALMVAAGCAGSDDAAASPRATVGILRSVPDPDHAAFLEELRLQGWNPTSNVRVLPTEGDDVVADLEAARRRLDTWLEDRLDVVVVYSTPFARLVADEYPQLEGLFVVNDADAAGLAGPSAADAGDLSGLTYRTPADRTLDVTVRALGGIDRLGYLAPADDPAVPGHREAVLATAGNLGIEVVHASFTAPIDVPEAVEELAAADVDVVFLASANATLAALDVLEQQLDRHRLPAVGNNDRMQFAVVVLMPDRAETRRQLARQTARLLAGTPASVVPVEDPRRFVLILNQERADRLGLPPFDDDLIRQASIVR